MIPVLPSCASSASAWGSYHDDLVPVGRNQDVPMGTSTRTQHERRNYVNRVKAIKAVLAVLAAGPLRISGDIDEFSRDVAERICKRLALNGLARMTCNGWEPAPPLLMPAVLVEGVEL